MAERDRLASVVARHWCELLDTASVADDDDFFELGGNSLQALLLAEHVEADLGVPFPLEELFLHGTFAATVEACRAAA